LSFVTSPFSGERREGAGGGLTSTTKVKGASKSLALLARSQALTFHQYLLSGSSRLLLEEVRFSLSTSRLKALSVATQSS